MKLRPPWIFFTSFLFQWHQNNHEPGPFHPKTRVPGRRRRPTMANPVSGKMRYFLPHQLRGATKKTQPNIHQTMAT